MSTTERTPLTVYLPSLESGGAERLHITLAPALIQHGFDVTFLVHRRKGAFADAIPEGVRVVSLECERTLGAFLPLVRYLKRARPAVLLSNFGHSNVIAIAAARFSRVPVRVVVTQHNSLSHEAQYPYWQFRLLPLLYRVSLSHADAIIAVSKGVAQDMAQITGLDPARIRVIYNPIAAPDSVLEPPTHPWLRDNGPPVILAVGRLWEQKGFDILLKAVAIAVEKRALRLIILGEGPLQKPLEQQAEALGIGSRVSLPGFHPHPTAFMRKAALLVMPSRHEGFGNVLVEALACGLPVVSTDCPYGPAEILENGRYGKLVPVDDAEAMATAILATLDNPPARETLRARGAFFCVDRAAEQYAGLLRQVLQDRP